MTEDSRPTNLADEVTSRVLQALRPEFEQIRGELRAAKKDLGQSIDALAAQMTADKASADEQFQAVRQEILGLRNDLSRHATSTSSMLNGHTARFRDLNARVDDVKDGLRAIADRLDRAHLPAE